MGGERKKVGTTLKIVWTGSNRNVGVKMERKATQKFGDAILTSGPITIKGKTKFGYAVSVPTELIKRNK